jgi:subtilase family serine protease
MRNQIARAAFFLLLFIAISSVSFAAQRQSLAGHVPGAVRTLKLQPVDSLPATQRLRLAVGLPLRNRDVLTNLLQQIYDPASPNYRHYLKPAQFVEQFGPTEADYESVVAFATTNGWIVTGRDPGRMLVNVSATVADVERVCHVKMRVYQHPREARLFFAPDTEPSLDLTTPVLDISGMNNYVLPHPASLGKASRTAAEPAAGSGSGGTLMGYDFRAAYAPGVTLDGTGQTVGLVEFDGFYPNDIAAYESAAGLPNVPITVEPVDGYDGNPTTNANDVGEVSLDIEMVISMAPGLSQLLVYEAASGEGLSVDILAQMANDGTAAQISCSWSLAVNATTDNYLQRLAAQGQSFFQASGDDNAYSNGIYEMPHAGPPADDAYVTSVGGTILTTSSLVTPSTGMLGGGPTISQGFWVSETVWNNYYTGQGTNGSGGGISTNYTIPAWQQDTSMAANGGSTTMRNIPDVAMVADNIWVVSNYGEKGSVWGTSCAAPLWAGFTALVNQQAAARGNALVGFINPAIYRLGNSAGYAAAFHDITTGNNTNSASNNLFFAVHGYDLCTGWGTPNGMNLINALTAAADPLFITPASGCAAGGAAVAVYDQPVFGFPSVVWVSGPFYPTNQIFCLTNSGLAALAWSATSDSPLWSVSPASGILMNASATNVTVTLTSDATNLALGLYSQSIVFSNLTLGTEQNRQFTIQAGLPPLTFDDLPGLNYEYFGYYERVTEGKVPAGYGGLNWSNFYYLSQTGYSFLPSSGCQPGMISTPNVAYNNGGNPASIIGVVPFDLLSAYLTAAWNDNLNLEVQGYVGTNLTYDQFFTLSATTATEIQFNYYGVSTVSFISSGGVPHSGYNGSGEEFVLDNVMVVPHTMPAVAPLVQNLTNAGGLVVFNWVAQMGETYQVQYSTDLSQTNWINLGAPLTATNSILTGSDIPTDQQRFYRLLLLP